MMIENPNGIHPIVTFDQMHDWESLLGIVNPELDRRGLNRLQRVLRGAAQCVVVERHYIDKDYRDTFSHFHSKRFSTPSSRCVRMHFFRHPITEEAVARASDSAMDGYLGYSVIRPTKPNCIGRTLLCHALRREAIAHLALCKETLHLLGTSANGD